MRPDVRAIARAGLLAGAVDLAFAFVLHMGFRGAAPIRIPQGIAAGLLGRAAFDGGVPTAFLGTLLHFIIATGWATIFALLHSRVGIVREWTRSRAGLLAVAAAYGVCVWLAMDTVVVPLSRARVVPLGSGLFWVLLVGHMPFVGLPIVWSIAGLRSSGNPSTF